ncbi:MAG: hypothetical protein LUE09_07025, partial [Synergistaceae bacterium]|nr:hypothetical protein [Synergistaceae bacterium]
MLVEFIQNPISAKAIRAISAFRGATGGLEPGYSLAYAAFHKQFHKQSPRWQVTKIKIKIKIIYITDDGRQYTQNYGYSPNAWDKIPTNVQLFKIWQYGNMLYTQSINNLIWLSLLNRNRASGGD